MYRYCEIVTRILVGDFLLYNSSKEQYQIEVYKNHEGLYFSRLFRLDSFDLILTFERQLISEAIYVMDINFSITQEKSFSSVDDALWFALQNLTKYLNKRVSNLEKNKVYKYIKIVKTFIVEEIILEDHSYQYKVEVYKNHNGLYFSRFYYYKGFDLTAIVNYSNTSRILSSNDIYIMDNNLKFVEEKGFSCIEECLNFALTKLAEFFHNKSSKRSMTNQYKYCEIVKIVIVNIVCNNTKEQYKIEVYKNHNGLYYSRFFRLDKFDLISTFERDLLPQDIYVPDDSLYITQEKGFICTQESLNFALVKLEEFYLGKKCLKDINKID